MKAPFRTSSGGKGWMWVDVARGNGRVVAGTLANEPDGGNEGSETGALMMKQQR